jgi:hypothetical protein
MEFCSPNVLRVNISFVNLFSFRLLLLGWFIFKFRRHNFNNVKSWLDVATFEEMDEPNINFHLKFISEKNSAIMVKEKQNKD